MQIEGSDADLLEERLLVFAARVGKVVDALPDSRLGRHVAGQLVRCGTSPAPNYGEACAAESRADFIHKLGIVLKELRETRIWLRLAIKATLLSAKKLDPLTDEATQLMNIIAKSIVTAKTNAQIARSNRTDGAGKANAQVTRSVRGKSN
jgi:four helix bundle protein